MKKNIREKFKQLALTVFAFVLIGVGYINFSMQNGEKKEELSIEERTNIGDVQLVSSNSTDENDEPKEDKTEEVANVEENKEEVKDEIGEYYTNSKLERDKMYSQMLEAYQKIADNSSISAEQKSIAITEISKITNQRNSIMIAENLIKNKGFADVLILINENSTSVIVRTENLLSENIAQIQNIVSREVGIEISKINITNKY